jgi:hypothetical protein
MSDSNVVVHEPKNGRVRFEIIGPLDHHGAMQIYRCAMDLLGTSDRDHPIGFTLDCARAGYVESRALDQLKRLAGYVTSTPGSRLEFVNVNEDFRAFLKDNKFDHCFEIVAAGAVPRVLPDVPV